MEYTNGYALLTTEGDHVGFILGSPSFKPESGECVFMLFPQKAEAVDTPLGIIVSELKVAGEHAWKKKNGAILVQTETRILLALSSSGEVTDSNGTVLGKAVSIPEGK
jgi:hypothetical protein